MSVEDRIRRLETASPFYAQQLRRHPDWIDWLDKPKNREFEFRETAMEETLERELRAGHDFLNALRRFRRRLSLRIAYRELNDLADVETSWRELTLLAEFTLRKLDAHLWAEHTRRHGTPVSRRTGVPLRRCILALGKLGAGELNFCSDLDLIYFVEGDGGVRRAGHDSPLDAREVFEGYFRRFSSELTATSDDGQLYHLDLRLRPEGEGGPLLRTYDGLINYYEGAGQTWERLAWLRARPVAGDLDLGHHLLEDLHPFRYPRFPPPNLLAEVAAVKWRTEKEVAPDELSRDIKTGAGGIREIEFIAQTLQLIHGGKNPFLQTHSTVEALSRLARYDVLGAEDGTFLDRAYRWLRRLENRLQMRRETPRHALPPSSRNREWLAKAMRREDFRELERDITTWRLGVHERYRVRFPRDPAEEQFQAWSAFFGGQGPTGEVAESLARWFPDSEQAVQRVRVFALGSGRHAVTRERVVRFLDVAGRFDIVLPRLARPLRSMERMGLFADRYGARSQFFRAASNPALFDSLAYLFDRSTAIYEWLCARPGMMDELLREAPRRLRSRAECLHDMRLLRREGDAGLPDRLWLYVRAEQIRLAIAQLLHGVSVEAASWALTQLAEAAVQFSLDVAAPGAPLAVIALGKLGGEELSPGADLDLLMVTRGTESERVEAGRRALQRLLGHNPGPGALFALDWRLRPHGEAGPPVATLDALRAYHANGHAQAWERQTLTRARPIAGDAALQREFSRWRDALLYERPALPLDLAELWSMRLKIEQEKAPASGPPERAFKTGPGGLLDIEFLAQALALAHGADRPDLRQPHTHTALLAARQQGLLAAGDADALMDAWAHLRGIEFNLRRRRFRPVVQLPADKTRQRALARWTGAPDTESFWQDHLARRNDTRRRVGNWFRTSSARSAP